MVQTLLPEQGDRTPDVNFRSSPAARWADDVMMLTQAPENANFSILAGKLTEFEHMMQQGQHYDGNLEIAMHHLVGAFVYPTGCLDISGFESAMSERRVADFVMKRMEKQKEVFEKSGGQLPFSKEELAYYRQNHLKDHIDLDWQIALFSKAEQLIKTQKAHLSLFIATRLNPALHNIILTGFIPSTSEQVDLLSRIRYDIQTLEIEGERGHERLMSIDKTWLPEYLHSKQSESGDTLSDINEDFVFRRTLPLFRNSLALLRELFPHELGTGRILLHLGSNTGIYEEEIAKEEGLSIVHVDYQDFSAERSKHGLGNDNYIIGDLRNPDDVVTQLTGPIGDLDSVCACVLINPTNDIEVMEGVVAIAGKLNRPLIIKSDHSDSQKLLDRVAHLNQKDDVTWVSGMVLP